GTQTQAFEALEDPPRGGRIRGLFDIELGWGVVLRTPRRLEPSGLPRRGRAATSSGLDRAATSSGLDGGAIGRLASAAERPTRHALVRGDDQVSHATTVLVFPLGGNDRPARSLMMGGAAHHGAIARGGWGRRRQGRR